MHTDSIHKHVDAVLVPPPCAFAQVVNMLSTWLNDPASEELFASTRIPTLLVDVLAGVCLCCSLICLSRILSRIRSRTFPLLCQSEGCDCQA
jgi:hypothetical protein